MNLKVRKTIKDYFNIYICNPTTSDSINLNNEWSKIIEATIYWHKDSEKIKIFEEKYIRKKNEVQICMELSISSSTLYCWENEILETALHFAIAHKLVKFDFEKHEYILLYI